MYTFNIYIISSDIAQAIGLRYILRQHFNYDALIIPCEQINKPTTTKHNILFISEDYYNSYSKFLDAEYSHLIKITTNPIIDSSSINIICDEGKLIKQLSDTIKSIIPQKPKPTKLSTREVDILRLIAKGYKNKEISEYLSISINTVLTHRKNIISKLGIKSISGLSIYAIMNEYISQSEIKLE